MSKYGLNLIVIIFFTLSLQCENCPGVPRRIYECKSCHHLQCSECIMKHMTEMKGDIIENLPINFIQCKECLDIVSLSGSHLNSYDISFIGDVKGQIRSARLREKFEAKIIEQCGLCYEDDRIICECQCGQKQCLECIHDFMNKSMTIKEIEELPEGFISCCACRKAVPLTGSKLDAIEISRIQSVKELLKKKNKDDEAEMEKNKIAEQLMIFERENQKLKEELLKQMKAAGNAEDLLHEQEANRITSVLENFLVPRSPCCQKVFVNDGCQAIHCDDCEVDFCGVCQVECFRDRDVERRSAVCHAHVKNCPLNVEFKGTFWIDPMYPECLRKKRFATEYNNFMNDEDIPFEILMRVVEKCRPFLDDNLLLTDNGRIQFEFTDAQKALFPRKAVQRRRDLRAAEIAERARVRVAAEEARVAQAEPEVIDVEAEVIDVVAVAVAVAEQPVEQPRPPRQRARPRCGYCGEHGHNRQTCPQRRPAPPVIAAPEDAQRQAQEAQQHALEAQAQAQAGVIDVE